MGQPSTTPLRLAREVPEERDDEIDSEVRLHVVVGLASPGRRKSLRVQIAVRVFLYVRLSALAVGQDVSAGIWLRTGCGGRLQRMRVLRNLVRRQRHALDPAGLADLV